MGAESRPYAVGPGEGRIIDLGAFAMTVKADEADTAHAGSMLNAEVAEIATAHAMEIVGPHSERYVRG